MTAIKTIVVGFEASQTAERALNRAADLAEALGARLVVTSVSMVPLPSSDIAATLPGAAVGFAAAATDELALAEEHLARARALLEQRGVQGDYVPEVGTPADRIAAVAEDCRADLIVVGTSEPGFLRRLLEGSVSEEVSRATHCDVLIVH